MHQILELTDEQNAMYRLLFMETLEDNIRNSRKLDFDLAKAQIEHGMYFGEKMLETSKARLFKQELSLKELETFNKIMKMYDNAFEFNQRLTVEDYKKFI